LELNANLLEEYAGAKDSTEIVKMQSMFGRKAEEYR
jgi:ribosome biogenesis protein Tsr3